MNSAILLALFASAAYATPAANPMCELVPLLETIYRAIDAECRTTNCVEDPENSCPANACTVKATIVTAGMAAVAQGTTIEGLIAMGDGCLDRDMYLAADKEAEIAMGLQLAGEGDGSLAADSQAVEARRCLLDLAAKLDAICPPPPSACQNPKAVALLKMVPAVADACGGNGCSCADQSACTKDEEAVGCTLKAMGLWANGGANPIGVAMAAAMTNVAVSEPYTLESLAAQATGIIAAGCQKSMECAAARLGPVL